MKLDDRYMTILTALLLFVGFGAMLTRGEDGTTLFGGGSDYDPKPDSFTLKAGRLSPLDVLLNDDNSDKVDASRLAIVNAPQCGVAEALGGVIQYSGTERCEGPYVLTYCVPFEGECKATAVTLEVINGEQSMEETIAAARRRTNETTPRTSGPNSGPVIMTDIVQAAAPEQSPQIAMARPVRLEVPNTAEVITPSEATESIRQRDVAVAVNVQSNDLSNLTSSGVNVSTDSARSGQVSTGGVSMAAPEIEETDSNVAIASVAPAINRQVPRPSAPAVPAAGPDTGPAIALDVPVAGPPIVQPQDQQLAAVLPSQPTVPPQPETPRVEAPKPAEPNVEPETALSAPSPGAISKPPAEDTELASAEPETAPVEEPSAQTRVAAAQPLPQPVEAPENSGVLASLARSSSFLGVTVSAARALLSPEESVQPTADRVLTANTKSAPRPKDFSVTEGLEASLPGLGDASSGAPLPQVGSNRPATGPAPTLVASLRIDDSGGFEALSQPARPPRKVEAPKVETPSPNQPAAQEAEVAALTPPSQTPQTEQPGKPGAAASAECGVDIALQVQVGAEIVASVISPCRPNSQFTVEHSGLEFSALTDGDGVATVVVPALVADASISATFADGASISDSVTVTNLGKVTRVAVAWDGDIDFDLHALEFGAREGGDGHIWSGSPRSYREARRSGGGYLTTLGPLSGPGRRAEVYTLFQTSRTKDGLVDLSLKLSAFGASCENEPVVRTLRAEGLDIERDSDIQFSLTGCEDASAIVVPNTIRDIRVSGR